MYCLYRHTQRPTHYSSAWSWETTERIYSESLWLWRGSGITMGNMMCVSQGTQCHKKKKKLQISLASSPSTLFVWGPCLTVLYKSWLFPEGLTTSMLSFRSSNTQWEFIALHIILHVGTLNKRVTGAGAILWGVGKFLVKLAQLGTIWTAGDQLAALCGLGISGRRICRLCLHGGLRWLGCIGHDTGTLPVGCLAVGVPVLLFDVLPQLPPAPFLQDLWLHLGTQGKRQRGGSWFTGQGS